jgi:hypothetical protein
MNVGGGGKHQLCHFNGGICKIKNNVLRYVVAPSSLQGTEMIIRFDTTGAISPSTVFRQAPCFAKHRVSGRQMWPHLFCKCTFGIVDEVPRLFVYLLPAQIAMYYQITVDIQDKLLLRSHSPVR